MFGSLMSKDMLKSPYIITSSGHKYNNWLLHERNNGLEEKMVIAKEVSLVLIKDEIPNIVGWLARSD